MAKPAQRTCLQSQSGSQAGQSQEADRNPSLREKDDFVQPGSLHLRGQRGAILTPDIVLKLLLLIIVISSDHRFFGSHRVQIVDGEGTKCGKNR